MEVEIPDELIERAKKVLEDGVRKGYYPDVPADAGIVKILERIVAENEKRVSWRGLAVPAHCLRFLDVQEHDMVDWLNKEEGVVELRKVVEKEDSDMGIHLDDWRKMDEKGIISSIDVGLTVLHEKDAVKECSGQLIALIEKIAKMLKKDEDRDMNTFIHADDWRKMTENDIISSIDVGLSVLDEKGFSKENNGQLLVLIEEIAKMLVREV